jgi:hypothetical protein
VGEPLTDFDTESGYWWASLTDCEVCGTTLEGGWCPECEGDLNPRPLLAPRLLFRWEVWRPTLLAAVPLVLMVTASSVAQACWIGLGALVAALVGLAVRHRHRAQPNPKEQR